MPRETFAPNAAGYAGIALADAMAAIPEGARPWSVGPRDLLWLKDQFREDFEREIGDLESYLKFSDPIQRLFHHVGATAAFLAEAAQQDVTRRPGSVTQVQLKVACKLVEMKVCPRPMERRRLCKLVPFLDDRKVKHDLESFAKTLIEGLTAK